MTSHDMYLDMMEHLNRRRENTNGLRSASDELMNGYMDVASSLLPVETEELNMLSTDQRIAVAQVYATLALVSQQTSMQASIEKLEILLSEWHNDEHYKPR